MFSVPCCTMLSHEFCLVHVRLINLQVKCRGCIFVKRGTGIFIRFGWLVSRIPDMSWPKDGGDT